MTDSSTELWEQRACRLALFSTAALTACRRRDGTGWVWGGDFLSRLPARAHPQPVHTKVSFLEQPPAGVQQCRVPGTATLQCEDLNRCGWFVYSFQERCKSLQKNAPSYSIFYSRAYPNQAPSCRKGENK